MTSDILVSGGQLPRLLEPARCCVWGCCSWQPSSNLVACSAHRRMDGTKGRTGVRKPMGQDKGREIHYQLLLQAKLTWENSFIANYCTYLITVSGIEKQKRKGNKHSNKWGKHLSSPFLRLDFTLDSSIVTAGYAVPSERLQVVQGLQPALSISPLCFSLLLFFTLSQVLHGDIPLGNFCSGHLEHLLLFLFLFLCLLLGVPSAISHSSSLLPFPVWQFLALNPLSLRCHHLGCRQVMQVMELAGTGCVQQGAAPASPHRAALQPPDSAWLWTASTDATTT